MNLAKELIKVLIKKERKPMNIQSLILSKDKFKSVEAAKKWAKDHDFSSSGVDETENSYRFRQEDPGKYKKMRTITLTDGVKAVVGKSQPTSSDVHVPATGPQYKLKKQEHDTDSLTVLENAFRNFIDEVKEEGIHDEDNLKDLEDNLIGFLEEEKLEKSGVIGKLFK